MILHANSAGLDFVIITSLNIFHTFDSILILQTMDARLVTRFQCLGYLDSSQPGADRNGLITATDYMPT